MSQKNLLYIAIVIPVLMLLIIIFSVRSSQTELHPDENFIYGVYKYRDGFSCIYKVRYYLYPKLYPDSYAKSKPIDQSCFDVKIYLYDFAAKTSKPLTIAEAKSYANLIYQKSKEGYTIIPFCNTGTTLGWWGNMNSYVSCLRKDRVQNLIHLTPLSDPNSPYNDPFFLGWIPLNK